MDDLGHAAAFIGRIAARVVIQNDDRLGVAVGIAGARQIARGDADACPRHIRRAVERIRNDADTDSAADDPLRCHDARRVYVRGVLDHAAFRSHGAHATNRLSRQRNTANAWKLRRRHCLTQRQPHGDHAVPPLILYRDHFQSKRDETRLHFGERRFSVQLDIRDDTAGRIGVDRGRSLDLLLQCRAIRLREFHQLTQTEAEIFRNRVGSDRRRRLRASERGEKHDSETEAERFHSGRWPASGALWHAFSGKTPKSLNSCNEPRLR